MPYGRQMKEDIINGNNQEDIVSMDIPLLIRVLEYAREDAKNDMDLHKLASNCVKRSQGGRILTMDHYDDLVSNVKTKDGDTVLLDSEIDGIARKAGLDC